MNYKTPLECLCCRSKNLVSVLRLQPTPLTDAYKNSRSEAMDMEMYPLEAKVCINCGHLQLSVLVDPEQSYTDYLYTSKLTTGLSNSFQEYAKSFSTFKARADVLDIGSNDGSFVAACEIEGHRAFGIEPSTDLANFANQNGRSTINGYFNEESSMQLKNKFGIDRFDIVSFNNVLANISSPHIALNLAKSMLKDSESKIFIQTGYHPTQFGKGLFDYIYHEHYSYFSLNSLAALATRSGLKITEAKEINIRGGSIRIELSPNESNKEGLRISQDTEQFITPKDFEEFYKKLKLSKDRLNIEIRQEIKNGNKIFGYGASHSTGTLVHFFNIKDYIDEIVDENTIKHQKFMPGTHLQVKNPEIIYEKDNEQSVVIVLAWQYFDQIRNKLIDKGYKGKIIKPVHV